MDHSNPVVSRGVNNVSDPINKVVFKATYVVAAAANLIFWFISCIASWNDFSDFSHNSYDSPIV